MTTQKIDAWILERFRRGKREFPKGRITNLFLGLALLGAFQRKLPRTDAKAEKPVPDIHNAQEIANRACQRLHKAGLITFSSKNKWEPTSPKRNWNSPGAAPAAS